MPITPKHAGRGGSRWDRSVLKHIPHATRLEVERRVKSGESGVLIARALGFPKSTWVGACKKNPWPGGVLDPKGKLAEYDGVFMDDCEPCCKVEWRGFEQGTKEPIRAHPRITGGEKARGKKSGDDGGVIPFPIRLGGTEKGSGDLAETRADSSLPSLAPESEAGASVLDESESEPEPQRKRRGAGGAASDLDKARRLINQKLNIATRVEILVECAQDKSESWRTRLAAIQELNMLSGLSAEAKAKAGNQPYDGPLWELPAGAGVSVMPVSPLPLPSPTPQPSTSS